MALLLRAHAPGRGCSACGFSDWYSTYRVAETTAAAKIIIDTASDQILGAHLLGPGYSELINTFGLAIKLCHLSLPWLGPRIPAVVDREIARCDGAR